VGDEPLHGCYRLDAVPPDAFVPVESAEALRLLDGWLIESNEGEDIRSAGLLQALEPVRTLLTQGPVLYYLPDLGREAQHDWGWVLWYFREWVVIDHARRQLHLVSLGLD
jgi:hypothetical protein